MSHGSPSSPPDCEHVLKGERYSLSFTTSGSSGSLPTASASWPPLCKPDIVYVSDRGHHLHFWFKILFSKFVVVGAVGTVEKRFLFFHGFHSPSVKWVHLAPCQPVAGLMFLVLSSSIPRR